MRGAIALVGLLLAGGCNDPTYLTEYRSLKTSDQTDGGAMGIAGDTDTFTIPIRRPTPAERTAINTEQMQKKLPMAVPFVGVRDLAVQVSYTIKNLDAEPGHVFFQLNGGTEFGSYDPGQFVNPLLQNQVAPPPLAGNKPIDLPARGTVEGAFREDDIAEAAIDLEAITRYPGMADRTIPFKVLGARSDVSRVGLEAVPANDVTPQMIHFAFQLSADVHVQVDYVVRVRDLGGRLAPAGSRSLYP